MDLKKRIRKLKFSALAASMKEFGLDPDEVDDKTEAVDAIYKYFEANDYGLDFKCPICGLDIPDFDSCPFCGITFVEGESRTYIGARKGRRPRGYRGPSGVSLLKRLIEVLAIPRKQVKWKKSVVSFWFKDGMICRCFIGAYSVRVQVPFRSDKYENHRDVVLDYDRPVKNMEARVYLEAKSDVGPAVNVLKQTIKLKTADRPKRMVGRPRNPIKPLPDDPKPKRNRHRPIQV